VGADDGPTAVIKRPVERPDAPSGPPVVRATVPQYPVSQTARFGVVVTLTVLTHLVVADITPGAANSGYIQVATLLICVAIPLAVFGVFLDQPQSRVSRWMLFIVCALCTLAASLDAALWFNLIMQARG